MINAKVKFREGSEKNYESLDIFPNSMLTKIFRVGRSDFDVHTYKSMQNLEYGDGRDLFPIVWKGFLYILSHP